MRRRLALLMLVPIVVAACGDGDGGSGTTTTSRGARPTTTRCPGCPTLGEDDTAITVAPGDPFVIELESNASTGYEWTATTSAQSVVQQTDEEYIDPDTDRLGAPGVQRFVFRARSSGTATLTLRYARSFQADDPDAREIVYAATVT
jgi:inhibitor of cysteine peptidase